MQYLYSIDLTREFWDSLNPKTEYTGKNFGFLKPIYYLPFYMLAIETNGMKYFGLKLADLKMTFHEIIGRTAGILKLSDKMSYFIQPSPKKPPIFIQGVIGAVVDDSKNERDAKIQAYLEENAAADAEYYKQTMTLEEHEQLLMPNIIRPSTNKRKELVERYSNNQTDTEIIG